MSEESFQSFFDKNFQSWDDVRSVVTLMMAFRQIDKYTEDKKLNKYQKLAFARNDIIQFNHPFIYL